MSHITAGQRAACDWVGGCSAAGGKACRPALDLDLGGGGMMTLRVSRSAELRDAGCGMRGEAYPCGVYVGARASGSWHVYYHCGSRT